MHEESGFRNLGRRGQNGALFGRTARAPRCSAAGAPLTTHESQGLGLLDARARKPRWWAALRVRLGTQLLVRPSPRIKSQGLGFQDARGKTGALMGRVAYAFAHPPAGGTASDL